MASAVGRILRRAARWTTTPLTRLRAGVPTRTKDRRCPGAYIHRQKSPPLVARRRLSGSPALRAHTLHLHTRAHTLSFPLTRIHTLAPMLQHLLSQCGRRGAERVRRWCRCGGGGGRRNDWKHWNRMREGEKTTNRGAFCGGRQDESLYLASPSGSATPGESAHQVAVSQRGGGVTERVMRGAEMDG